MDIFDVIKDRRSVRRFKSKSVGQDEIQRILEAGKWAPSAGNLQAREVILVTDDRLRQEIAEAALNQSFISEAPILFIICANRRKIGRYGKRGKYLYCIQDASIMAQNMILMAQSLGLGSCWVGAFDENALRRALGIPEEILPVAIIPVGYSNETPSTPPRDLDLHINGW